jgi:ribose transport system substrate-binding protein
MGGRDAASGGSKMKIYAKLLCGTALAVSMLGSASAANLDKVGISVGSLGNPFFVATIKGITDKAKSINPNVQVISVSSDYDLNKQATQIDNFIAAGVNVIMLNAVDAKAIAPAVERAHKAGIVVAAFDVGAQGADVTVMTDNVKAGTLACQYIVDHLPGGKGDVLIVNGPQVTSVVDRVKGCKEVFAKNAGVKVLSSDQDAKGSRDGGMAVTQSLLTANPKIDAIFAINDPTGIGSALAAKQMRRDEFFITAVDGAPDIEAELKTGKSMIKASSSQDPYTMAGMALEFGAKVLKGEKIEKPVVLLDPVLITNDNLKDYKGWTSR